MHFFRANATSTTPAERLFGTALLSINGLSVVKIQIAITRLKQSLAVSVIPRES